MRSGRCDDPCGPCGSRPATILSVPNLAALQAIDVRCFGKDECVEVEVETLGCTAFYLERASTVPVDGITVVATSTGTGRWIRGQTVNETYRFVTDWYVDPVGGNDENVGGSRDGSAAPPLKTLAEIERRLGVEPILVGRRSTFDPTITMTVVHILGDCPISDPLRTSFWRVPITPDSPFGLVAFLGEGPAKILRSGTLTAAVVLDPDGNQTVEVTDPTVTDWTPFVGKRIRITSGLNSGSYAYVAKDLGAGAARTSPFCWTHDAPFFPIPLPEALSFVFVSNGSEPVTPATYVVEDLTQVYVEETSIVEGTNDGVVGFSDLRIRSAAENGGGFVELAYGCFSNYAGCIFGDPDVSGRVIRDQAGSQVFFTNCASYFEVETVNGVIALQSGLLLGGARAVNGGNLRFANNALIQGGFAITASGGRLTVGTLAVFDSPFSGVIVDSPGWLDVFPQSFIDSGLVWGDGNGDTGIMIAAGASVFWDRTALPDGTATRRGITGTLPDFRLAFLAEAHARAFDEATGLYTAGALAGLGATFECTWANIFSGGFSGTANNSAHQVSENAHLIAKDAV